MAAGVDVDCSFNRLLSFGCYHYLQGVHILNIVLDMEYTLYDYYLRFMPF